MKIAAGIHRIEIPLGERIVCVYLVEDAGRALLIDAGLKGMPESHIGPYLNSIGLSWGSVKYVLTSHVDFDHTGGNEDVRRLAPDALFLAHHADAAMIEDVERMIEGRYACYAADHAIDEPETTKNVIRENARHTHVDVRLVGGEYLQISDQLGVELWHTPGHSLGHMSVWEPNSRSLIIADAALGVAVPTADGSPAFPPTYCLPAEYRSTINRLARAQAEHLLTSHYQLFNRNEMGKFLASSLCYVDRVEKRMLAALAHHPNGLTLKEMIRETWHDLGEWPDGGYLSWPMAGHLREFELMGLVRKTRDHESYRYQWTGPSRH